MLTVELRLGPVPIWRTDEPRAVAAAASDMRDCLARAVRSQRLPAMVRRWAAGRLSEIKNLESGGCGNDERTDRELVN